MRYLIAVLGVVVVLTLAYIASRDKRNIRYRPIVVMIILQIFFAFVFLNTGAGEYMAKGFSSIFGKLLAFAMEGISFVFGSIAKEGDIPLFFGVLMPITFISILIGILQYTKILPFIIRYIGLILSKVSGMGRLESYNAVASAMLGMVEVFISIKKQLGVLPQERLYTLCASAMSTVSMSIVGAYLKMIEPRYVLTAMVLNLFGGFIIASIISPYTVAAEDDILEVKEEKKQGLFEMLAEYIMDGFKIAVTVAAMLIGFVALIGMINGVFAELFGIRFQVLLGYIFAPLAFIMGVPISETVAAGSIMAIKLLSNEFVAMLELIKCSTLSVRTIGILSVFLVSFANFASIGVIVGAVKGLDEKQGSVVAGFGLRLVYGATLVSILSATIVGLFL